MNAIKQLKNEHEAITLTLSILDKIIAKLYQSQDPQSVQDLNQLIDFFKTFADKCHHGKEEDVLFPALMELGISNKGGPIGVMLAEHEQGRSFLKQLSAGVDRLAQGDGNGIDSIAVPAQNYISLLTRHIEKEDHVLFPMAERHLSQEAQRRLLETFEEIEIQKIGIGKHEELHALIDRLNNVYSQ